MKGRALSFFVFLALIGLCTQPVRGVAQELRAELRISTEQLGTVDKVRYTEMERQLTEMLNNTRWTTQTYAPGERIACSFALKLLSVEDDVRYKAELSITASRPVYRTSYTTTTMVHRDTEVAFELTPGQSLEFNPEQVDNHLVAILAFYAQYIIAMDLDSFSPLGGSVLSDGLAQLASQAAGRTEWEGWRAFGLDRNRGSLAMVFTTGEHEAFRQMWYAYHRLGLDMLEGDLVKGRAQILSCLKALDEYRRNYPNSPLLSLFETAKLDELVKLFSEAPADEKRSVLELCRQLFATRSDVWQTLAR